MEEVKYITFDTPGAPQLKVGANSTYEEIADVLKSEDFENFMVGEGFAYKYGLQPVNMLEPDNLNDNSLTSGAKGSILNLKQIGANVMGGIYDIFGAEDKQAEAQRVYEQYKLDRTAYIFRQQPDGSILPRPSTIEDVLNDEKQFKAFTEYLGSTMSEGAITTIPIALATIIGGAVGSAFPVVGTAAGGAAGLYLSTYLFAIGDIYGAQIDSMDDGDATTMEDPVAGIAFALGIPYAYAERLFGVSNQFISNTIGTKKFKNSLKKGAMQQLKNKVKRDGLSYPKSLAKHMAVVGASEAVAEGVQETLNITGGEFLQAGKSFEDVYLNKDFAKQIGEAAAAGFFGGYGFGVIQPTIKQFKLMGKKGAPDDFKGEFGNYDADPASLEGTDLEYGDSVSVAGIYTARNITGRISDNHIDDPKLTLKGSFKDKDGIETLIVEYEGKTASADGSATSIFIPASEKSVIFKKIPKVNNEVKGINYKYNDEADLILDDNIETRQKYSEAKKKLQQTGVINDSTNKTVDSFLNREKEVERISVQLEQDRKNQKQADTLEAELENEAEEDQPIVRPTQYPEYLLPGWSQQFDELEGDSLRESVNKFWPSLRKQNIVDLASEQKENKLSKEDNKQLRKLGFNGPFGEEVIQGYRDDVLPVTDFITRGRRKLRDIIDNNRRFEDVVPPARREVNQPQDPKIQIIQPLSKEEKTSITGSDLADPNAGPMFVFNMSVSQRLREIKELAMLLDFRGWKIAGSPHYESFVELIKQKQKEVNSEFNLFRKAQLKQELKDIKNRGEHLLQNPFTPKGAPLAFLPVGSPKAIMSAESNLITLKNDPRLLSQEAAVRKPVEEKIAAYENLILSATRNRARLNELLASLSIEPIFNWNAFNGTVKGLTALRKRLEQTEIITKTTKVSAKAERWSVMSNTQPRLQERFKNNTLKVAQLLRRRLDALGLSTVQLDVFDKVLSQEGFEVNGKYLVGQRLVQIALNARPDINIYENNQDATLYTLHHEVIHALKDLGLFTPQEYARLRKAALDTWIEQFDIKTKYPNLNLEEQAEEAISEAFAAHMVNRFNTGTILGRAFQRIKAFIYALADSLRGADFGNVTDIFEMIDAGIIGNRDKSYQATADGRVESYSVDLWKTKEQVVTSEETSINKTRKAAVFNILDKQNFWKENTINMDIGGGKFNNATIFLNEKGVKNYIYDPYNRTEKQNNETVSRAANGKSDTVTINNVLNVIPEENAQNQKTILLQAKNALKIGGTVVITNYEGDGTGVGKYTTKGYQQNKKLTSYLEDIKTIFPNAKIVGKTIRAIKETGSTKQSKMYNDPGAPPSEQYTPLNRAEKRKILRDVEKYSVQMNDPYVKGGAVTPAKLGSLYKFIAHYSRLAVDYPAFTPLWNFVQKRNSYTNELTQYFASELSRKYLQIQQDPAAKEALTKAHIIALMTDTKYTRNREGQIILTAPAASGDKNNSVQAGEVVILTGDVAEAFEDYDRVIATVNKTILKDQISGEYGDHLIDGISLVNKFLPNNGQLPDLNQMTEEEQNAFVEQFELEEGQGVLNLLNQIGINYQNRLYGIESNLYMSEQELTDLNNTQEFITDGFIKEAKRYKDRSVGYYAPMSRYGTYYIAVKDDQGRLIRYEQIESETPFGIGTAGKARQKYNELVLQYPDATVSKPEKVTIEELRNLYKREISAADEVSSFLSDSNAKVYNEVRSEVNKKLKLTILELQEKTNNYTAGFQYFYMPKDKSVGMEGVPGYETDFTRSTLQFISAAAAQTARNRFNKKISIAYRNADSYAKGKENRETKDPNLEKLITKWMDYADSPVQEHAALRRLGFWWYLGGNISSAFLQIFSAIQNTGPMLSELTNPSFVPGPGAVKTSLALSKAVASASKMVGRGITQGSSYNDALLNVDKVPDDRPGLGKAITRAIADGTIKQGQAIQEAGITEMLGGNLYARSLRAAENTLIGGAFNSMEAFSRITGFIAAYRMSTDDPSMLDNARLLFEDDADFQFQIEHNKGKLTPEILARYVTNKNFGVFGKINRQLIGRKWGSAIGLFMTYISQMVGQYVNYMNLPVIRKKEGGYTIETTYPNRSKTQNKMNRRMVAKMLLALMITGGVFAVPGGEDAEDFVNIVRSYYTGIDSDIRDEFRKMLYEVGFSPRMITFATSGAFNAYANMDISRRVGLGNLPWSTQVRALASIAGLNTGVRAEAFLGAPGSVFITAAQGIANDGIREGNYGEVISKMFPNFIRNAYKGGMYAFTGEAYSGRGILLRDDLGFSDAVLKAAGFAPNKIAAAREAVFLEKKIGGATSAYKGRMNTRLTNAFKEIIIGNKEGDTSRMRKGQEQIQKLTEEIIRFNSKVPPNLVFIPDIDRLQDQAKMELYTDYRLEKQNKKFFNEKRNLRIRLGLDG